MPYAGPPRTLAQLAPGGSADRFADRHLGPDADDVATMLDTLGVGSLEALLDQAVPKAIRGARSAAPLRLGDPVGEQEALARLRAKATRNTVLRSMIGAGWYGTVTPPVVQRNILENPAWYTAYTPYQPEISQGRLEALLNFQTMIADLTGLDTAGASLLDEATAAAEAMTLCRRQSRRDGGVFLVDADCHPQVIDVVRTRADALGLAVTVVDGDALAGADPSAVAGVLPEVGAFGVLVAEPGSSGALRDHAGVIEAVHAQGGLVAVTVDPLACVLLEPPGARGADVVVGSAQRFGVPMGFGGPHAGFMAVRGEHRRSMPGRLVGVSVDTKGRTGLRLALQTREQHIRREKATSNICTAQVLLAVMASTYAVYHGPDGLRVIAERAHRFARVIAAGLADVAGVEVRTAQFFDTLTVRVPARAAAVAAAARERGVNLRLVDVDHVGISCDETTTVADAAAVLAAFGSPADVAALDAGLAADDSSLPAPMARRAPLLEHPVFHRYRSETELLRYLRRLADRDLALDRTMIPLGSCTMKLNATAEMLPVTWPELADLHPYAPLDQAAGYLEMIHELEDFLVEITGYDAVSLQPNAGSQGELSGLLAIRAYHRSRGDEHRDVCLIPGSAHGTNAASAVMAGMRVVVVSTDEGGDVDVDDLRAKLAAHEGRVAALMVTYPSTHGVYEEHIVDVCDLIHAAGGQVYLDGANLNALVGVARPGVFGADVSHLNLHKTFCIPHGGGGPGVGPICVRAHLAPFLPGHPVVPEAGPVGRWVGSAHPSGVRVGAVSAAPWGSAGILAISWMYVTMMGAAGLREATAVAILNANYVATRLGDAYPVLYTGGHGRVAHECILDVRPLTQASGVTAEDVAKRLIDYGFHAPTLSFPVAGTLMVEPTESESRHELDRFCDAMLAIRAEIDAVVAGTWPRDDNPLRNAPHPAEDVTASDWPHPYSREVAGFPVESLRGSKYWPPVSRIDAAFGDRNVVCTCPPLSAYDE